MFKVGRWRNEKFKVVFRLQFQATKVPCFKSRLTISLVPADVGQPTVRLGKAVVQEGICTWDNPIYETVKLIREIKTGKIQDKIYHFIVSSGSSKEGFSGEVSVNLARYAEATTPFTISVPIRSSNSGALLHVTIQNVQGADDQRELEEHEASSEKSQNISLQSQFGDSQLDGNPDHNTNEADYSSTTSNIGDLGSRHVMTRGTSVSTLEPNNYMIHDDSFGLQSPPRMNIATQRTLNDVMKSSQLKQILKSDASPSKDKEEPSNSSVEWLKRENFTLKKEAEVTELELQSLRRQVVKESKRGQELSRQIVKLKEERDSLKAKSEKLEVFQKRNDGVEVLKEKDIENKRLRDELREAKEELIHEKEMNESLQIQSQKLEDSNSELILVVRDLEEMLDMKDKQQEAFSELITNNNEAEMKPLQQKNMDMEAELEGHRKDKSELEVQIEQLTRDYEILKQENEKISIKFKEQQLELVDRENECTRYLSTIEELESQMARLEEVIKKQAEEFSESSDATQELENKVKRLKQELEKQGREFEEDLEATIKAKNKQEKRAIQAEEELWRTKQNNNNTAQQLQEEFKKLSTEMTLKFEENEKLTIEAQTEARSLQESLRKAHEESESMKQSYDLEVQKLSEQLLEKERELKRTLKVKDEYTMLKSMTQKEETKYAAFIEENQTLRNEVERLTEENYQKQKLIVELEEMKMFVGETKRQLEVTNKERDALEKKYAFAKMEAKQSQDDFNDMKSLNDKKEAMAGILQSEFEILMAQYDELKSHLSTEKSENDTLRKQVSRQRGELQQKDQVIAEMEDKFRKSAAKDAAALREKVRQPKGVKPTGIATENGSRMGKKLQHSELSLQNGATRTLGKRRESLPEKDQKRSILQTADEANLTQLLAEVQLLKEENKSMECELKEMQEKYSEISLRFAEVEGERQQLVMTIRNLRNGQKK